MIMIHEPWPHMRMPANNNHAHTHAHTHRRVQKPLLPAPVMSDACTEPFAAALPAEPQPPPPP